MYIKILKIFGILGLIVLQLSLFNKLSIFESIPNVIFLLSIALFLRGFLQDSFLVGVIGGLFLDLASPLRFGVYTLLILAILLLLNYVVIQLIPAPHLILVYLIFIGIFVVVNLVIFLGVKIMPNFQILVDAAINGIWGVLIYLLLERFQKVDEIKVKLTPQQAAGRQGSFFSRCVGFRRQTIYSTSSS